MALNLYMKAIVAIGFLSLFVFRSISMRLTVKLILVFSMTVVAVAAASSDVLIRQIGEYLQIVQSAEKAHLELLENLNSQKNQERFQQAINSKNHVYFQKWVNEFSDRFVLVRYVSLETNFPVDARPMANDQIPIIRQSKEPLSFELVDEEGQKHMATYYPLDTAGQEGALEFSSSFDGAMDQSGIWLFGLLTICASALLGIATLMTVGVRWIAKPLSQLTEKMERVGEGDFENDLHINSNDELGQLAVAVNQMCDKLKSQQDSIRQKSEQKLKTLEQLRHADRLKTVGQLAAGLAHEVGTPLNVVSGRASMILSDPDMPPEKIAANANTIKTEADRISSIIQKLMDFARRSPLSMVQGDLKEVIVRAVDLIGPMARGRSIDIQMELPDAPANAKFDFNQMQQVFMNLIDNAVDASPDQSVIKVTLAEQSSHWELTVEDHGPGIKTDDQHKVFEPFFTTKDVGDGTGLGLSIVHGIVEEHGGKIRFENRDSGAAFIVDLPRDEAVSVKGVNLP